MLTRLVALLVLSGALGVLGQDAPTPVTYTFGLEHVCVHGRITGVVNGDTINVLIQANPGEATHQGSYRFVARALADRSGGIRFA
jgi:hypothetical protein